MKRLAALLLCLPTVACGFHPLYGAQEKVADTKLPDIFVAVIPGRNGQLLRQSLQQRLQGTSEAEPQGYKLVVAYALQTEAIGIHGDNTSARARVTGRANWSLSTVAENPVVLATGAARSVDGFNEVETQYFASTIAGETTSGRVADNLADSIRTEIVTWFVTHPDGVQEATAAAAKGAPPAPLPPTEPATRGYLTPQNVPGDSNQSPLQQVSPDGLPAAAIGRTVN